MLTAAFGLTALRIALAILFDVAALLVWDIGTRSPGRLADDVGAALRHPPALLRGALRFVIGIGALLAAVVVSATITSRPIDFTIIECWALLAALIIEQLIGPDVRASVRGTASTQRRNVQ